MLNKLYTLICDNPLKHIYSSIFDLRITGKVDEVNKILREIDINKITPVIMLGFLTVTAPIKSEERENFYNKVEERLLLMYNDKDKVERMLVGLK